MARTCFLLKIAPVECEFGYCQLIRRCAVGLLEEYDEGWMHGGHMLDDVDLAVSNALCVQLQNSESTVHFDSASTATPREGGFPYPLCAELF